MSVAARRTRTPAAAPSAAPRCPACGRGGLEPFFELSDVPVFCNVLWADRRDAAAAPRAPLRLGRCRGCGMIYNTAFAPERLEYGPAYENALHFSTVFRGYSASLARDLVARHGLAGSSVVEIGCGQGDFLRELAEAGLAEGVGFDPSHDPRRAVPLPPSMRVTARVFDPALLDGTPGLVCCRHVLEHLARPMDLLRGLRAALPDRAPTVVYFEVPAGEWALGVRGIWDLIYEHCAYYTAASLERLFTGAGFAVGAVRHAYGGQFLAIEAGTGRPLRGPTGVSPHGRPEVTVGFARRFEREVRSWRSAIGRLRRRGARPAVWGAGSKGATFLNILDRGAESFVAAIDLNPAKQGRYVSGTGHPIVGPEHLAQLRPTHVVVMNPLYHAEIATMLRALGIEATLMAA